MATKKAAHPAQLPLLILLGILVIGALALVFFMKKPLVIVNAHESVESVAEIVKLQATMADLGIERTVLTGIPEDLLYFEGNSVDLGEVEENNEAIRRAAEEYPEQFSYFCTLDPNDPLRNDLVETCIEEGASGVKLYNGYSYAHDTALDDAKLAEFYALLQEKDLPLMLPVNTSKYEGELRNVLTLYPDLTVICPHFCLSSKNLPLLTDLMTEYPNLYIDTSFGHVDFVEDGFNTIRNNSEAFQEFFDTFQDRILFGTDAVVTSYEEKNTEWLTDLYSNYITLFETDLNLPKSIQKKIFYTNWMDLTK